MIFDSFISNAKNKNQNSSQVMLRTKFHRKIRHNQILQIQQNLRKALWFKQQQNYNLLKDINLYEILQKYKHGNHSEQIINKLFMYASSTEADHLYELFDFTIIDNLQIDLYNEIELQSDCMLSMYGRKVLWILANYTSYSNQIPSKFEQLVVKLWQSRQIEVKELAILCISNLISSNQQYILIFNPYLPKIIQDANMIISKATENNSIAKLLQRIVMLLDSCFEKLSYGINQQNIDRYFIFLIHLLIDGSYLFGFRKLILDCCRVLFLVYINTESIIVLRNQANIQKLAQYTKKLTLIVTEQKNGYHTTTKTIKQTEQQLQYCLNIFAIIYGINIPQNQQQQNYYQFLNELLELYLLEVIVMGLHSHSQNIDYCILQFLEPVCLQECMIEILIEQIQVFSTLFRLSLQNGFKLRKRSINCLCNILHVIVEGQSKNKQFIMELFWNNNICDLLATNLYEYVDQEINQNILEAIWLLGSNRMKMYNQEQFWIKFQECNGISKLETIIKQSNCLSLVNSASKIREKAQNMIKYL